MSRQELALNMRALIVEDDDRLRQSLVRAIGKCGAETIEARTVRDALRQLESQPELVVMDVRLPDGDSFEVARTASARVPAPLIVAMSGSASAEEAFRLATLGVREYLSKPFQMEDFLSTLRRALSKHKRDAPSLLDLRRELLSRLEAYARRNGLTAREQEVARLAVEGIPRARFASELGVSENTCKTLIRRVLVKCEAARLADIPRLLLGANAADRQ
ncbi:MAG: response regulator transcription factor [Myxococcales bacterium]|nr:response regulator transcription factor [Myxococcales bacterium]